MIGMQLVLSWSSWSLRPGRLGGPGFVLSGGLGRLVRRGLLCRSRVRLRPRLRLRSRLCLRLGLRFVVFVFAVVVVVVWGRRGRGRGLGCGLGRGSVLGRCRGVRRQWGVRV